jgi:rhomboid protease GluP
LALPYQWQMRVNRWRSAMSGFFGGGGDQQPRPKICPSCGTLVGINATRCHQCGTSLNFSMAAINRRFSGFFGGTRAPVTTALLIINILMFGVSLVATLQAGQGGGLAILWGLDIEVLYRLGALWAPAIVHGEPYRLVTAMFLHGGLIHIGFNMMVLMDIGPVVEEVYGSARYLFLYLVTGIAGYVLSAYASRLHPVPSVGASGAILGLIGLMIAITTRRGGATMQALRSRLISWVVSIFVLGYFMRVVDNWAHFGGLAAGFLLGKVFADREPMNSAELKRAHALGWGAAIVLLASFAFMILHFRDPLR